jgi:hypothetical protein
VTECSAKSCGREETGCDCSFEIEEAVWDVHRVL